MEIMAVEVDNSKVNWQVFQLLDIPDRKICGSIEKAGSTTIGTSLNWICKEVAL